MVWASDVSRGNAAQIAKPIANNSMTKAALNLGIQTQVLEYF